MIGNISPPPSPASQDLGQERRIKNTFHILDKISSYPYQLLKVSFLKALFWKLFFSHFRLVYFSNYYVNIFYRMSRNPSKIRIGTQCKGNIWENNPSVQNMASFCNMESSFVHFEEWTQVANYAVWTHVAAKNHPKGKFHGRFCSDWPRPKLEVCFSLVSELPYTVAGGVAMLHRELGLGLPLSW